MGRKKVKQPNPWDVLYTLIIELEEWARADEMKGGGDPSAIGEIEAGYNLAKAKVNAHIERMKRGDFDDTH